MARFLVAGLYLALFAGWLMNIVKLAHTTGSGMVALRVVGIFMAPLGALLGFVP
jgi:hypothetical protein